MLKEEASEIGAAQIDPSGGVAVLDRAASVVVQQELQKEQLETEASPSSTQRSWLLDTEKSVAAQAEDDLEDEDEDTPPDFGRGASSWA